MKSIYSPAYRSLLAWLRGSRQSKGLTLRGVGLRMGVPHTWVGKVETGERRLDVAEYVQLCRAIEVEPGPGIGIVEAALTAYPSRPPTLAKAAEAKPATYRAKRRIPRRPSPGNPPSGRGALGTPRRPERQD